MDFIITIIVEFHAESYKLLKESLYLIKWHIYSMMSCNGTEMNWYFKYISS